VMARIDPQNLLARVPQLAASEHIIAELVDALESIGSREAQCALAELARSHYITAGQRALRSLAELGAYPELLQIVLGDLPRRYREIALGLVGERFGVACLDEIEALSVRNPEPSIRKIAFHHLSSQDERITRPTILSAMDDPELRSMALQWLHRLPPEEAAPFCVRLLDHQDGAVRGHATALLAAMAKGSDTLALAYQLLSKNPEAREATLAVLMWRNELSGLPLALKLALELPEPLPYPGALLFPERTIVTWWLLPESVAAPLRRALRQVRTTWSRAVAPVVQSLDP